MRHFSSFGMPKISSPISDDYLLKNLDLIAGDILLIPRQVGMLIGKSVSQLKEDRTEGNPPPFVKTGGSIRYRIGDVRGYLKGLPIYPNTTHSIMAERAAKESLQNS